MARRSSLAAQAITAKMTGWAVEVEPIGHRNELTVEGANLLDNLEGLPDAGAGQAVDRNRPTNSLLVRFRVQRLAV